MRILLIDPPFYRIFGFYNRYFPFGVATIGTVLRNAGHDVLVYDADANDNPTDMDYTRLPEKYQHYLNSFKDDNNPIWLELRKIIKDFNPAVVGISIWTTFAASAFHIAKISKEINSSCPVIMGGPHATVKADEILKILPYVDYIVRGEGESTVLELVQYIESEKPELTQINGLSYKQNKEIKHNTSREMTKDLDKFPFPDRSLLMNEKRYTSEDMGLIMTSRGCPYGCTYCSTDTRRVSYRSIENVLREIRLVKERYGTTQFSFKDDSFTVNRKRVEDLCDRLIAEKLNINWECNTRVNLISDDLLEKMKRAGCNSIKVGIESGSERVLREMNKGITHEHVRNAARLFRKTGIHWTGYFMMGVPGETVDDVYKTLNFMYEVKPDFASIGVYEPFPGTPMFVEGIKRGLVKPEMTLGDFYTSLPNHYYIANTRRQIDTIDEPRFTALQQEIKEKFHSYNKSYRQVLKRVKSRANIYMKEPSIFIGDIKKYLSWR
ncbi:MAG: hypothetical protein UT02_C0055G0009 [Parcubacteria group bacterium GW2011_GWC2_38_7]|nr:MAG: hypothetical protein UT02_C0055G0009 [Parcubacteria group bacterium GW2011_GWC2_38_7]